MVIWRDLSGTTHLHNNISQRQPSRIIHVPPFLAMGTQCRSSCHPVVGARWRWQGAQKYMVGCPAGRSWHITSSPGQRELWQGLICALGAPGLHFSSSCCCRTSFSPPPLVFISFWYLQKFSSSSLRLAKLWAKIFCVSFKYQSPRCFPGDASAMLCCSQTKEGWEGKTGALVEPLEDLEFSWESKSKNKKNCDSCWVFCLWLEFK